MQKSLPLPHSQIAALTQEKSRSPPRKQDLRTTETAARETEQEETHRSHDYRHPHDTSGITFGGLTWAPGEKLPSRKRTSIPGIISIVGPTGRYANDGALTLVSRSERAKVLANLDSRLLLSNAARVSHRGNLMVSVRGLMVAFKLTRKLGASQDILDYPFAMPLLLFPRGHCWN